jgi:hypothetical protein
MSETSGRAEGGVMTLITQMTGVSTNTPVNWMWLSPFSRVHLSIRPLGGGILQALVGYPPCQAIGPDPRPACLVREMTESWRTQPWDLTLLCACVY